MQSYKIFGSMDAIGDPVGVVKDLSSSLKLFLLQTGLELSGQSPFRAEGLKHLAQGIIGSPFGSLGKVTRGFGQFLSSVSNMEMELGQESAPAHIGEGVIQAGVVFGQSIHHGDSTFLCINPNFIVYIGVVNVIKNPYQGIQEGNALHAIQVLLIMQIDQLEGNE